MTSMRCHRCSAEMASSGWRCPSCGAQSRLYTRGQIVVAALLALLILFFVLRR